MTNREVVERQIEAGNRFAFDEVAQLSSDDMVVDFSRSIGPAKGVYRGVDEVRELLVSLTEAFESIIVTPHEVYERGNWIALDVHVRFRGRGSGAAVEARGARAYELADAKVIRLVQFQSMDEARAYIDAQP
jgi:ketosteroid isomerase-like protein